MRCPEETVASQRFAGALGMMIGCKCTGMITSDRKFDGRWRARKETNLQQQIESAVISGRRDDLRLGDECNLEVQHLSLRDTDLLTGKLLDILVRTPWLEVRGGDLQ